MSWDTGDNKKRKVYIFMFLLNSFVFFEGLMMSEVHCLVKIFY